MPSFDIVSEVDQHELTNAVDQANREIGTRYDFKGANAKFELQENKVVMTADNDFQLKQMLEILPMKVSKRGINVGCLDPQKVHMALNEARQEINIKQGIDKELAKKITKLIKESKIKVQSSVQGEQVRITGKKRDDLQEVIALMKSEDLGLPLQYVNFRD
jgi:uncharacterized protein YajQ (UPF0234 family)